MSAEQRVTHGRHCTCSPCAAQDWADPQLAPCGMHGRECPPVYAPLGAAGELVLVEPGPASGTIRLTFNVEAQVALSRVTAGWTDAEARALLDGDVDALEGAVAVILDRYRDELRFDLEHTAVHGRMADELPPEATA